MSNPGNAEASTETFAQQVNNTVNQLTQDDKGTWVLPKDLEVDESVKFAATLEKRRRDTESALSKTRNQLKTEEALREALEKRGAATVKATVPPEEAEALELLKFEDPEAWRVRMNTLEQQATAEYQEELNSMTSEASQKAELARRAQVLEQFNMEHSDAPITDEALINDIPPRISKKLEDGKVTFDEFLQEAYKFLVTPKTIKSQKAEKQPNLGGIGGGDRPTDEALALQDVDDYQHTVF